MTGSSPPLRLSAHAEGRFGELASAGIWRPWTGVRGTKAEPVEGELLPYAFLTSEPNGAFATMQQAVLGR